MNYAVEQRIRFIDFLASHYGAVRRSALVEYFGISEPQATRDLRLYKETAPENLLWDGGAKQYIKATNFKSIYANRLALVEEGRE